MSNFCLRDYQLQEVLKYIKRWATFHVLSPSPLIVSGAYSEDQKDKGDLLKVTELTSR